MVTSLVRPPEESEQRGIRVPESLPSRFARPSSKRKGWMLNTRRVHRSHVAAASSQVSVVKHGLYRDG